MTTYCQRLNSMKWAGLMTISNELQKALNDVQTKYGGKTFANNSESVYVGILPAHLEGISLDRCNALAGEQLIPVASIEDQFDSLLMLSASGCVYLCFVDGERLSVEPYAKNFREAICKTLNVKGYLLWMYRKRITGK